MKHELDVEKRKNKESKYLASLIGVSHVFHVNKTERKK